MNPKCSLALKIASAGVLGAQKQRLLPHTFERRFLLRGTLPAIGILKPLPTLIFHFLFLRQWTERTLTGDISSNALTSEMIDQIFKVIWSLFGFTINNSDLWVRHQLMKSSSPEENSPPGQSFWKHKPSTRFAKLGAFIPASDTNGRVPPNSRWPLLWNKPMVTVEGREGLAPTDFTGDERQF